MKLRRTYPQDTRRRMAEVVLLILGSYQDGSIEVLRGLKRRLREEGFTNCHLVEDFDAPTRRDGEEEDAYLTRKSIYWVERSDACLFVFNTDADNESVGYELKHASDHLPAKLETTLVAVDSTGPYASTLVRGHIQRLRMERTARVALFRDEETLYRVSRNAALSFLRPLAPVLALRGQHFK
jgi:hypothetical protein